MNARRVVVVTGASGALGAATCAMFGHAGWQVVGWDARAPDGDPAAPLMRVDVSSSTDVNAGALEVLNLYGRIDALVNSAAIQVDAELLRTSDDDWSRVLQSNVTGAFYCIRAMAEPLQDVGGAIVNVSSVHAVATSANAGAYAVSKTALIGLTRAAAVELGPGGVRCNALLPGAIESPMLHDGLSRRPHHGGSEETLHDLRSRTPLRSIAAPPDIARSILFLADTERSPFVTGACLVADGGALVQLSTE